MGIVKPGFHWDCIRCGNCCRNHYTEDWIVSILKHIGGEAVNGMCPRLNPDNYHCTRYTERPPACRGFPFTLKKISGIKHVLWVYPDCPGIGEGPELDLTTKAQEVIALSEQEFGIKMDANLEHLNEDGYIYIHSFDKEGEDG